MVDAGFDSGLNGLVNGLLVLAGLPLSGQEAVPEDAMDGLVT
jgi:hypothetical protein